MTDDPYASREQIRRALHMPEMRAELGYAQAAPTPKPSLKAKRKRERQNRKKGRK